MSLDRHVQGRQRVLDRRWVVLVEAVLLLMVQLVWGLCELLCGGSVWGEGVGGEGVGQQ